ncbi:MAG: hypothetical protein ABFE01_04285, partial [Phycisphaerales bacterium]
DWIFDCQHMWRMIVGTSLPPPVLVPQAAEYFSEKIRTNADRCDRNVELYFAFGWSSIEMRLCLQVARWVDAGGVGTAEGQMASSSEISLHACMGNRSRNAGENCLRDVILDWRKAE